MSNTAKPKKPTSIWTNEKTHDALKQMAESIGVSQGKCIALLIEEKKHRDRVYRKRKRKEFENLDVPEALNQINRLLEKIEKRENPRDTIVSFFRIQEQKILNPMSDKIEVISTRLQEVIDALKAKQ